MKKSIKVLLALFGIFIILLIFCLSFYLVTTAKYNLDESKIVNLNSTVEYYDINGKFIEEQSGGVAVTEIKELSNHVKNAFISIEDKRFYNHKGVDFRGLARASVNNLKSHSFKQGASTISQQLIKNTHLSNEKTLKRKLVEFKLARQLEKKYNKDEILEKYLNTIYFGDGCYGITDASMHYFGISADKLTLNQSAMLAGIIKAPSTYSPFNNQEKCFNRKDLVLSEMYNQGYITKEQLDSNYKVNPILKENSNGDVYDYVYLVKKQLSDFFDKSAYQMKNVKIYTYFNPEKQQIINENFNNYDLGTDKSIILTDNSNKIIAYKSTCGEIKRQLGSVIKPLLVYAPALENNLVHNCTIIDDEKIDINGYTPSNVNDKYYGKVSVRYSLSKSLNTCAVKLLNYVKVENALPYLEKVGINYGQNDKSLALALGSSENGFTLKEITTAYNVFNDYGNYTLPSCVDKIITENGRILFKEYNQKTKVFSDDTVELINDSLKDCIEYGTSKNLKCNLSNIRAKTGTAGNKNGNTDAYSISYNPNYVLGVWYGNKTNKLMENKVSGGTYPTLTASTIWNDLQKRGLTDDAPFDKSENIVELNIDKISYEKDNKIEIADDIAPERYILKEKFRKNNAPIDKSKRFISPTIETPQISINNNIISIRLCQTQLYNFIVFKEFNGIKRKIFDTKYQSFNNCIFDQEILPNTLYSYSVVPYYEKDGIIYNGNPVYLNKIKTDNFLLQDTWWDKDVN